MTVNQIFEKTVDKPKFAPFRFKFGFIDCFLCKIFNIFSKHSQYLFRRNYQFFKFWFGLWRLKISQMNR